MHDFKFKRNHLYCENVKVEALAEKFGTPLYVYSYNTLLSHYRKLKTAFRKLNPLICYSVKANPNLSILKTLVKNGAGLDIVSGGELFRAKTLRCPADKIVYASVGKTIDEITAALEYGILFFNVESLPELEAINRVALKLCRKAKVAIRINPDVEAKTHKFITTGKITNKFGIDFDTARAILRMRAKFPAVSISGLHIHIGSQITRGEPFVAAIKKVVEFISSLSSEALCLEYLNIGGGLGIVYDNESAQTAEIFASRVIPLLARTGLKVILEPGRFIVGNAGILVARVVYVKETPKKKFIIVDAGMNDLIRPSLYGAYHRIVALSGFSGSKYQTADVVGPICESGDFFAKARDLPQIKQGQFLAVMSAGSYGFSMSSNYNSRRRAAEVMVKGRCAFIIRQRESFDDLIRNEKVIDL